MREVNTPRLGLSRAVEPVDAAYTATALAAAAVLD
jgi:hypothetical protein